jgi:carboxymethylenebutenolidase
MADRDDLTNQREARIDQLMRGSGVSTESVHQRAQEAITRSRQLIARSAAAMDRCEALLRRQAQRARQEQSATDRERPRAAGATRAPDGRGQVTTAIAQFMRELERVWDEHREAALVRRDLAASLAQLAAEPSVWHIPAVTGAAGRQAFEQFYAEAFLPHVPADLVLTRMSRTVDRFHLVDETTLSFTHDRELPWLLPGVAPTRRRAKVLAVAIVGFERGRIRSQRILWDYATLTTQLGIPGRI